MGGGNLTTPVKKRAQDVDAKVMIEVAKDAPAEFAENLKIQDEETKEYVYNNVKTQTLGELKASNEKLYNIIEPLAQEAKKMYVERELPEDIMKNSAKWLTEDVNTLNVTLATVKNSKGERKFNGRFSPMNDLLITNYSDSVDDLEAKFLIAHEFAHAIALHVSEEKTTQARILEGAGEVANVALEVAINEAYIRIPPVAQKIVNMAAEETFSNFFEEKDLETENKILKAREESFSAKALLTDRAKNKELLTKIGIDLDVPLKTKMVIKHLVKSGLDAAGAIDALKGGVNFASANAIAITGHPQEQEMEADSIALSMTKRIQVDPTQTVCKRFEGNKEAGLFDAHPSYADRRENLGCAK